MLISLQMLVNVSMILCKSNYLTYYTSLTALTAMTEIDDVLKVLKDWRQQPKKTVTKVLSYVEETKTIKGKEIDILLKGVTQFHREIARVEEQLVQLKWYDLCIGNKKKLKKLQEAAEKQKKKSLPLQKKLIVPLVVQYPPQLTAGRGASDERTLKYMYKSFVTNFEQAIKNPKTWQFILCTFKQIKYKFDDRLDGVFNKRVMSICTRLAKESSTESKSRMLNGQITPKELSNDEQETYFSQKTKDNIKRIQMEELERCRTGFYEQMKRQINKDACEECKFCHKAAAYCEDQKQIRASDEPMTRFMRCNSCDKSWKD